MNALLLDEKKALETRGAKPDAGLSVKDPMYIDVRTPLEFDTVHIMGSRNIPLPDLHKFVDELKDLSLTTPLLLVCRTQNRVKIAYEYLINTGVTNCSILEGGITGWISEGKPVVRGRKRLSLEGQVRTIAGALILLGLGLSLAVHGGFLLLPLLVGAGLLHAGLTDSCLMGMVLAKLPYNRIKSTISEGQRNH